MAQKELALLFLWTLITVTHGADDLDLQSLSTRLQQQEVLVQQQAAFIQQLQASLAAVQSRVTSLEASERQLTTRLDTRVSFTAYMSHGPVNVGTSNSPLVFDTVVTNIGGGYNHQTGVFTAPAAGIYVFNAALMNHEQHPWLQYAISKGGTVLCQRHLDQSSNYDKASCEASVHLQQGDTIIVRRVGGDGTDQQIDGYAFCSFTGFLLSPDSS